MMVSVAPRASTPWLAIWPTRPKPMINTLALRSLTASTPSIETSAGDAKRLCSSTVSGVSAMDSTTMAVMLALTTGSITPAASAAANSTKANSPPWAISTARSSASACELRASRATP
ncbi:hypothetical protein FQZ97_1077080 [compost metagenome]